MQRRSFALWSKENDVVNKDRYKKINIVLFHLYEVLRVVKFRETEIE